MPLFLFAAFVVVPLVELAVIIQVGDVLGLGWTILLLLAFSVLGAVLVRREGRRAWSAFREALAVGRWPGDEVVQGALVLVGGALLLTPGFVTDITGFLLLLPPSRALVSRVVRARLTPVPMQVYRSQRRRGGKGARQRDDSHETGDRPDPAALDVEVVSVERDGVDRDS